LRRLLIAAGSTAPPRQGHRGSTAAGLYQIQEDDMTVTLNPTCPLCGLRYASRPMLELHIREDHRQRRRAEPGGPSRGHGVASRPSLTRKEVTAMTATRRVIRAVRHVNDELVRASEAIIRSARAPQPRPPASAPADAEAHLGTVSERAGRAA
jgi:hypothetical protein